MKILDRLAHFYTLLTSDLTLPDMIRRMKSDASSTYQYYSREADPDYQTRAKKPKFFKLFRNLFLVFIRKLSPVRRIAYFVALVLFFWGFNDSSVQNKKTVGFILLNIILAAELADKLLAKDELDIARNIQIDMMPKSAPDDSRFDMAFHYESANTVGGDFYDFLIDPKKDGFVAMVGDISGKGMEAALHMVQVHTLFQGNPYPSDMKIRLIHMNTQLRTIFPANHFLTASFLKADGTDKLEFCRAGHLPLYHVPKSGDRCNIVAPSGIGLGLSDKSTFEKSLEPVQIGMARGDVFCMCTDGVIEAENPNGTEFGEPALIRILKSARSGSAGQILQDLIKEINRFRSTAPKKDDLTLFVMKVL
ncbi:serine/threonine-protein phosphatase [bacterium]|nr:serine/threonine-protein phosphatase [bacterium]